MFIYVLSSTGSGHLESAQTQNNDMTARDKINKKQQKQRKINQFRF
jgi:hypothetical protein